MKFYHEWKNDELERLKRNYKEHKEDILQEGDTYNLAYDIVQELVDYEVDPHYSYGRLDIWPSSTKDLPFIIEAISDFLDEHEVEIETSWKFNETMGWWRVSTLSLVIDLNVGRICKKVKVGTSTVPKVKYICGGGEE